MMGARSGVDPSRFDAPGRVTHLVRSSISSITLAGGNCPVAGSNGASTCSAPAPSAARRHGVMLASWSSRVPTIRSPGLQRRADRPRHGERQRRHVGAEADAVGVGPEELPDRGTCAVHQSLAFLGGGERSAVGCSVATGHPLAHRGDRRVDHLRAGRPVEPRPLRPDAREPVPQRRHSPSRVFRATPGWLETLDWPGVSGGQRYAHGSAAGHARLARLASRFAVRPMGTMLRWSRSPTSMPLAKATL